MTTTLGLATPPGLLHDTRAGWYLLAANRVVECGPFPDQETAERAAVWMDERGEGANPAPWTPRYSRSGLTVGSRWRPTRRPAGQGAV